MNRNKVYFLVFVFLFSFLVIMNYGSEMVDFISIRLLHNSKNKEREIIFEKETIENKYDFVNEESERKKKWESERNKKQEESERKRRMEKSERKRRMEESEKKRKH